MNHPMNDPISPLPSWRRPILRPPINPEPAINKNDLPIISNRQPKGVPKPRPVNPLNLLEQKREQERRLKYLIDLNNLTNLSEEETNVNRGTTAIGSIIEDLRPGRVQREINRNKKARKDMQESLDLDF